MMYCSGNRQLLLILWLNEKKRREEKRANFVLMLVNFLFKYVSRLGDGIHIAATGKPGSQSEKISKPPFKQTRNLFRSRSHYPLS